MELVLATQNPSKVTELAALLADGGPTPHSIRVLPRPDGLPETVEDAPTLEGNASKKAHEVSIATGLPTLADDTGLFVDGLDGRPGVLTARYGGWENLLMELGDRTDRAAHFRTVLVLEFPDDRANLVVEGRSDGQIAAAPTGDQGFGYDPVFVPDDGGGLSFAQMDSAAKNLISHRGRALQSLVDRLADGGR